MTKHTMLFLDKFLNSIHWWSVSVGMQEMHTFVLESLPHIPDTGPPCLDRPRTQIHDDFFLIVEPATLWGAACLEGMGPRGYGTPMKQRLENHKFRRACFEVLQTFCLNLLVKPMDKYYGRIKIE